MVELRRGDSTMIEKYFEEITDQRQPWKIKHNMLEVIVMTIIAVMSGCDHWEDIVDFCRVKENWFKEKIGLKLKNGVASHDTFQRIFALIKPAELEKSFSAWTRAVSQKTEGEVISIDGKTIRGSRDEHDHVIHMVSAWANKNQMVMGQVRTEEKSNEITAIPALLELLEVEGCIITIDAMGCQKEIAGKIIEKEAGYVLSVKENHPNLYEDVKEYFRAASESPSFYPEITRKQTAEKGHGRFEKRTYWLSDEVSWITNLEQWPGLKAIGAVHSYVERDGGAHEETRYFITSVTDIKIFAHAVRSHWGIENSLHWCLDMVFDEDHSTMRVDNSGENFAVIRHIALNLLKSYPIKNVSLARKRRRCGYDDNFVADVLFSQF